MPAYYNENNEFCACWLKNLSDANLIAPGDVDSRSIVDVQPDDLKGYDQCHFFAGIAGWSLAARLAGWPDSRPLWSGSCPCQPFSVAGRRRGTDDPRHLWPHFHRLISASRPPVVLGEQVARAVGEGWLDGVFADLEGIDYTCRAVIVPACAVNAPHRRDRLWFVAHTDDPIRRTAESAGNVTDWSSSERHKGHGHAPQRGHWDHAIPLDAPDGRKRPVAPELELLADGIPGQVDQLRAFGNAIVPQLAAEVLGAFMDVCP